MSAFGPTLPRQCEPTQPSRSVGTTCGDPAPCSPGDDPGRKPTETDKKQQKTHRTPTENCRTKHTTPQIPTGPPGMAAQVHGAPVQIGPAQICVFLSFVGSIAAPASPLRVRILWDLYKKGGRRLVRVHEAMFKAAGSRHVAVHLWSVQKLRQQKCATRTLHCSIGKALPWT